MKFFSRKQKNKHLSIGIDFGTTVSRITYIDSSSPVFGIPEITPVPSVISAHKSTQPGKNYDWRIGAAALAGKDYVTRIKLKMGYMRPVEASGSLEIRPELLASKLIWTLKSKLGELDRELRSVKDATISVPAEWGIIHRQATIMAAKIAGFHNINLIEEPVAAFIALKELKKEIVGEAKKILVFDCGGGTLDITVIINHYPSLPFVAGRATNIGKISGENIDDELAKAIIGESRWFGGLTNDEQRRFARVIRELKEQINPIVLHHDPPASIPKSKPVNIGDVHFQPGKLELTLKKHNDVLESVLDKTEHFLNLALKNCVINNKPVKIKPEEIDLVLLVGGSSYLRPLQERITNFFNKELNQKDIILLNPESLVVTGAAYWQSYLDHEMNKFTPTLSMETYLKYEIEKGVFENFPLGKTGDLLPIVQSKPGKFLESPILDIPRSTHNSIDWKVYQDFAYSDEPAVAVEQIKYQGKLDRQEKIRLKYKIDKSGNLTLWKPDFIFALGEELTPELPSLYDWANKDPEDLARTYEIRKPNEN